MEQINNCVLLLPRLQIQNFNTISSPMTWGAPAITSVLGFMQTLQRKIPEDWSLDLVSCGIVVHEFQAQTSENYVHSFHLTRNPLDKSGSVPGIIEEGRAHLTASLVFEVSFVEDVPTTEQLAEYAQQLTQLIGPLRLAGGSILPISSLFKPEFLVLTDEPEERKNQFIALRRKLLPGFALISRQDVLEQHTSKLQAQDPSKTTLDAWLDLSRLHSFYQADTQDAEKGKWVSERTEKGWLVPIPVGYSALSAEYPAGEVQNARDPNVPFRFVESMYSIGEWKSPHRMQDFAELLWENHTDSEQGIYCCVSRIS